VRGPAVPNPPARSPAAGFDQANTTCDIYITPNVPPAAPNTAAVPITLTSVWQAGAEATEGTTTAKWTHVMKCARDVDIRDTYPAGGAANRVYVPDKNGTRFDVIFVETVNRGTATEYKRVFLVRQTPGWPTNVL